MSALMVSVGKSKVILFQISSNDWQQRQNAHYKMTAKESIYATKNQIQYSVRLIKRAFYETLAHQLKRQEE